MGYNILYTSAEEEEVLGTFIDYAVRISYCR